uniref:ABC transporter domain-containing protein n=1 Tax=Picocystis salinarum TaxID=88271 RepID=A0A7S3XE31_9CHLO
MAASSWSALGGKGGSGSEEKATTKLGRKETNTSLEHVHDGPAVEIRNLDFSYPGVDGQPLAGVPPLIQELNLVLPKGSRCLLLGANGAGKTTLLKVIGGKHMVPKDAVHVLGRPAFHDTDLTSSGDLSYIGGQWEREVAFAGYAVPLLGDFSAQQMIDGVPGKHTQERKKHVMEVLDVDPDWRMNTVSDGQRRRVQLAMGLLNPFKVLLLDEITVDLDVLGRADLMQFLKEESVKGATIIYTTHIFDGLESWPTHIAYISHGRLQTFCKAEDIPELQQGRLLELVEGWLRKDLEEDLATLSKEGTEKKFEYIRNNGWVPGRLTSSLAGSSNTVMRR